MRYLAILLLALCGCAIPYRAARTTHTLKFYRGRPDGLVMKEELKDTDRGWAVFFLTDPKAQSFAVTHRNQPGLGGGSVFRIGEASIIVDTNAAAVLGAGGTLIGNAVGAGLKAASGLP